MATINHIYVPSFMFLADYHTICDDAREMTMEDFIEYGTLDRAFSDDEAAAHQRSRKVPPSFNNTRPARARLPAYRGDFSKLPG